MVAVRFCPQLFRLQSTAQVPGAAVSKQQTGEPGPSTADEQEGTTQQQPFQLPYRMLFAIATLDSIIVYDTQVCGMFLPVAHRKASVHIMIERLC